MTLHSSNRESRQPLTPYYQESGITIYHGDCRELLPSIDPADVSLVLSDPPYGVSERTDRGTKGRGTGGKGLTSAVTCGAYDFPPVYGDDKPFDPSHLLRFPRLILFGANHYADRLPPSPTWIVWDKLDGIEGKREIGFDDNADCELAWSNCGGPARLIPHRWKGLLRRDELRHPKWHPTQKPVLLMAKLITIYGTGQGEILDPYMGSGTTLRAAKDLNRRAIGIEVEERYCEIAAKRLAQEVLAL